MTLIQRVAICFAAGVIGALAVVLFSHVLFALGIGQKLGVKEPVPLKSPDVYRPLFWGGLWGIPFGLLIEPAWTHLYLFGFLYFPRPGACAVYHLPAKGRAAAGRAGFGGLPGSGQFAVWDRHRAGRQGDHRGSAVNVGKEP